MCISGWTGPVTSLYWLLLLSYHAWQCHIPVPMNRLLLPLLPLSYHPQQCHIQCTGCCCYPTTLDSVTFLSPWTGFCYCCYPTTLNTVSHPCTSYCYCCCPTTLIKNNTAYICKDHFTASKSLMSYKYECISCVHTHKMIKHTHTRTQWSQTPTAI